MTEETLFHAALAKPTIERAAFLDGACLGQPQLRAAVEALLAAHAASGDMLDRPAGTGEYTSQNTADYRPIEPGAVIGGRYTLEEPIGEGGMGQVWVAKQSEPVKRRVALKLIKAGMDTRAVLQRFEIERQALAMMDHPNIAKVLDGGMTDDRRPYFVMELVNGLSLTKYCDNAKLTPRQRLELFVPICQAVQHAHHKGIVHRDLKPSNILITLIDGKPVPKVIDFGVAKATGGKLTDESMTTQFGAVIGTLEYMAPEQASFSGVDIDTRADIYSLGVILYELLTGLRPFDAARLKKAALTEMVRIIQEEEPSKPSTRLSTHESLPSLAASRQMEPKKLMALLRGELDCVVMKCLEKSRERRYETANALARDIQRYLADEPVEARPPSAGYRLGKFLRRNKGPVVAAGLVFLALLGGMIGTSWGLMRANRAREDEAEQRQIANSEKQKAEKAETKTLEAFRASTNDAIEQLIGSKPELGPQEKSYLKKTLERWREFAQRSGDDERSLAIQAEGHYCVGSLWVRLGRYEEAQAEFQSACDILKKLIEQFPADPAHQRNLATTYNDLANVLASLGKRSGAEQLHRIALTIQEKLVDDFPTVPTYRLELARSHHNLGMLLEELGKRPEAVEHDRIALTIHEKLATDFPTESTYRKELAGIHQKLGGVFAGLGRWPEAEEQYRKALTIHEKLAADFPALPAYRKSLARNLNSLGNLHAGLGKRSEAEEQVRRALSIEKKLAADFPAVPEHRRDLALSHYSLGIILKGLGNRSEAEVQNRQSLSIQEKLAADFPSVPDYRQDLARSRNSLGLLLAGLGKRSEANDQYRNALAIQEKLAADFPAVPDIQLELAGSYCNYGSLVRNGGRADESLDWFGKAIATLDPVQRAEPRKVTAKQFLRNSHEGRAMAFDILTKPSDAVKDWDRAIELSPPAEQPRHRASRATSLLQAGMVADAVAEVAELTKSTEWNAGQWYDFACVYAVASGKVADKKHEYADRAMELLQKSVSAGNTNAAHLKKDPDLGALREREDFKALVQELEAKAAAGKPAG